MAILNHVRAALAVVFRFGCAAGLLFAVACSAGPGGGTRVEAEGGRKNLVGRWKKISTEECARLYPDELEFHEVATYLGKKGPDQRFIVWDAGTYRVADETHLLISTATDELVSYRFSISGSVLTFVDDQGCEYRYQRLA